MTVTRPTAWGQDPLARAAVRRTRRRAWSGMVSSLVLLAAGIAAAASAARVEEAAAAPSPTWVVASVSVLIGAGSVLLVLSFAGLWRARRRRNILRAHPFLRVQGRFQTIPAVRSIRAVALLEIGVVAHLPNVLVASLERAGLAGMVEVDVAGESAGPLVVRGPADPRLFTAVGPRSSRADRRWRAAAGWPPPATSDRPRT